jgi:hypothetical protein
MARRFAGALGLCAVAACLAWADWRGPATGPATLIGRVDVIGTVLSLALVPALTERRFGQAGQGWRARLVRLGGYAAMVGLVLLKTHLEWSEFPKAPDTLWLAGIWVGEALFLIILAAYIAGVGAVTSRRPLAGPVAVATGGIAGGVAGLVMYALPPRAASLHLASTWMADLYQAARVAAVPLVLCAGIFAGVRAARRTRRHDGRPPGIDSRARQGMAAGICAGVAAALTVSLLGISTIALLPHETAALQWTLPSVPNVHRAAPPTIYDFEVSLSDAGAGYLLVLLFFPLLGAGLGAWGGLYGADRPGRQSGGGGGGGGPDGPDREPPPPPGGRTLDSPASRVADMRRILGLPEWDPGTEPVREGPVRPEKVPLGPPGQD